jgi:hypothetical protein
MWNGSNSSLPIRARRGQSIAGIRNAELAMSEVKSLTPGDVLPISWSGEPLWNDWNTEDAINDGLKASSWV